MILNAGFTSSKASFNAKGDDHQTSFGSKPATNVKYPRPNKSMLMAQRLASGAVAAYALSSRQINISTNVLLLLVVLMPICCPTGLKWTSLHVSGCGQLRAQGGDGL